MKEQKDPVPALVANHPANTCGILVQRDNSHGQSLEPCAPLGNANLPIGDFWRMAFLESTHFTAKTSSSAHVVPCGGTATKYSFSSGTNKPVLPSGPVGIFPMA
jgi:hypothetical protein